MGTKGVQVAPFGPKLCQNVAPRLRIIYQTLLGLKTKLKKKTKKQKHVENPDFCRSKPERGSAVASAVGAVASQSAGRGSRLLRYPPGPLGC